MKDARALLAELVACPSPSGEEQAVAALVEAHALALGLCAERVGSNVVLRRAGDAGPVRLLFASHLDTVPVGEGWTRDPHAAVWRDGRLFGRGANDAKASAAAMLWAFGQALQAGEGLGAALALTACEETTNAGMGEVLEHIGPPAMAVVGEPTGLAVVRAQAGLAVIEAEWEGVACHAAHAPRSAHTNALVVAAGELARLGPFATLDVEGGAIERTSIVPTVFESGTRHNVVPDRARAVIDCRLAPPHDARACLELLSEALPSARLVVRSDRLRAVETPANHPLVQSALAATGAAAPIGSNTMSDMALLADVPAIKCGPGESARSHTPDEFVTAEELDAGCRVYRALFTRWTAPLPVTT